MYLSINTTIIHSINSTLKNDQVESLLSNLTEHQDLFWPIIIGFFVALALGLMICRSKFFVEESSEEIHSSSMKTVQKKYFFCCWFIRKSENGSIEVIRNSIIQRLSNNENDPNRILNSNSSDIQSPIQRMSQQLAARFGFHQRSSAVTMMPLEKKPSLRRDSILSVLENEFDQQKLSESIFHSAKMDFHSSTDNLKTNQFFF